MVMSSRSKSVVYPAEIAGILQISLPYLRRDIEATSWQKKEAQQEIVYSKVPMEP